MGIFDFMNKKQVSQTNKIETIEIDGYVIDKNSGELIDAPIGREVYNIPDQVTKISVKARNNMKNSCKKLLFSDSSLYKETSKVFSESFLTGFDNITEIRLPKGLEKLDGFFDSNGKTRIDFVFPPNLKEMGYNQFPAHWEDIIIPNVSVMNGGIVSHNPVLKSITIPQTIKELQQYSINQVKNLKTIKFNEGILKMHPQAVRGCNNLTEIYIPESLKEFYLADDDVRPVKNNFSEYKPDKEQQLKEQERVLNLYKTINGKTYHFIVPRKQFLKMAIVEDKVIFNDNLSIEINSLSQEMYIDIINKTIKNTQTASNSNQNQTNINNTNNTTSSGNQEKHTENEAILKYEEMLLTLEQEKQKALQSGNTILYYEKEIELAKKELGFTLVRFQSGDETVSNEDLIKKRIEIKKLELNLNMTKYNCKLISFDESEENDFNIKETISALQEKLKSYSNNSGKHR